MRIEDSELRARLQAVGLDPDAPGNPAEAWRRLRAQFGRRATLLDRYSLEAAERGVAVEALDPGLREQLALEVLAANFDGFELVPGSSRGALDPIEVVPYDEQWPIRFVRWRSVLAEGLGENALRIEHVGSTAVPGLAAKPVVDIQISVTTVDDEPAYVPVIERASVSLRSRDRAHRYFRPSEDRPRDVQIHVCDVGGAWERDHLLLRDFLRADARTAEAYGRLKTVGVPDPLGWRRKSVDARAMTPPRAPARLPVRRDRRCSCLRPPRSLRP
ncbi:MAG TPA: GrpB family protein [Candidatus Limnocylindrales bacterium]